MSLLLVRHGQASFGAADYDQLSERGQVQSRRLGDWLAQGGHRFEAVVVGGMLMASTIALFFVPMFYRLVEDLADWRKGRGKGKGNPESATQSPVEARS